MCNRLPNVHTKPSPKIRLYKKVTYIITLYDVSSSYDNSENYGTKRIFGCTDQTRLADVDHYIRDVIVSRAGDISILLDTNNIIYGKVRSLLLFLHLITKHVKALHDLFDLMFVSL